LRLDKGVEKGKVRVCRHIESRKTKENRGKEKRTNNWMGKIGKREGKGAKNQKIKSLE